MGTDPKEARKASLKDAMDGTETDVPLRAPVEPPASMPALAPLISISMEQLQAIVKTSVEAAVGARQPEAASNAVLQALLESQAATLKLAANPGGRHSNSDEENPRVSVFNAEGEKARPRPGLKCHMYFGQYDEDGKIDAAYPVVEDSCTYDEQIMLNQLAQGEFEIARNDDRIGKVVVQERRDGAGKLNRIIIAYPYGWMSKEFQTQLPPMRRLLKDILAQMQTVAA